MCTSDPLTVSPLSSATGYAVTLPAGESDSSVTTAPEGREKREPAKKSYESKKPVPEPMLKDELTEV